MGNRIEEVKRRLDKYRGAFICDNKCQDRTNETIAQEICQLFGVPLVEVDVLAKREAGWWRLNTAVTEITKGD